MGFVLFLAIQSLWGGVLWNTASKHGWNRYIAFATGFLFGLLGILGYGIAEFIANKKARAAGA